MLRLPRMQPGHDTARPTRSLTGLLLRVTTGFALLALAAILLPALGRACQDWLESRVNSAHLAALALEAAGEDMLDPQLQDQLLTLAGVDLVSLRTPGRRILPLAREGREFQVGKVIDLRTLSLPRAIVLSIELLIRDEDGHVRVIGDGITEPTTVVDLVMERKPLVAALHASMARIVITGVVIAGIASLLLFLILQLLLARPMRALTDSIRRFADDPERPLPEPRARRKDEIGAATEAMAQMQSSIRQDLWRKSRLAALGTAVAKVNHDLRGVLATALLVSDRLSGSSDPKVRASAPQLLASIERAVALCSRTMEFVREGPPTLNAARFELKPLIEEAGAAAKAAASADEARVSVIADAPGELALVADREMLFRVVLNLARNAIEAGATRVTVTAREREGAVSIELADNGRGLPPALAADPFKPFQSSRRGGSGLGLSIVRDLVRAHGGEITVAETGPSGTRFHIALPLDASAEPEPEAPQAQPPAPPPQEPISAS